MPRIPFDAPEDASPEELRTRLEALAALVARAPVPIAVAHDADCGVITANAALAELLGVPPDSNVSMTPTEGTPAYRIQRGGHDLPVADLPMQYAIRHRQRVTNDIEIVRADGRVVFVQNDVEPLYDASGQVCGCVSVCVDLTERKRIEEVLRETDRVKDQFMAVLSHELRNPLAAMRHALDLMRRAEPGSELAQRAVGTLERQMRQLVHLTDDLLDVSRIARNRLKLRRERVDLRDVVHSAVEAAQPLIDAAGHILSVRLPREAVWVDADLARLAQAFTNLLNNAAKYTNPGGRIALSVETHDDRAILTVSDSGIGIPPELLPRVFDLFMQLEPGADRMQSGLGIGLTLARRLIEMHGGTIDASSDGDGAGATFTARLPLVPAAVERPSPEPPRVAPAPRRVLVAEDLPDAAEMLRLVLESAGHDVRVAVDGAQAVALALEFRPDVALLDIGMPRMDGYEAARRIRAALGPRVRLVALTGWGQEDDTRRARDAGFDRHLTKPADLDTLQALLTES